MHTLRAALAPRGLNSTRLSMNFMLQQVLGVREKLFEAIIGYAIYPFSGLPSPDARAGIGPSLRIFGLRLPFRTRRTYLPGICQKHLESV